MAAVSNNQNVNVNLDVAQFIKSKPVSAEIEAVWAKRDIWMPDNFTVDESKGPNKSQYKFAGIINDGDGPALKVRLRIQKIEISVFYHLQERDIRDLFYFASQPKTRRHHLTEAFAKASQGKEEGTTAASESSVKTIASSESNTKISNEAAIAWQNKDKWMPECDFTDGSNPYVEIGGEKIPATSLQYRFSKSDNDSIFIECQIYKLRSIYKFKMLSGVSVEQRFFDLTKKLNTTLQKVIEEQTAKYNADNK